MSAIERKQSPKAGGCNSRLLSWIRDEAIWPSKAVSTSVQQLLLAHASVRVRRRDAQVPENSHHLMPLHQGSAVTQTTNLETDLALLQGWVLRAFRHD
jgi:hypothetical protein